MSSLQEYLASNYLKAGTAGDFGGDSDGDTAPAANADYEEGPARKKKKKSKKTKEAAASAVTVVNEDDDLRTQNSHRNEFEDDQDGPSVEVNTRVKQETQSSAKWKKVGDKPINDTPVKDETKASLLSHGLQTPDQVAAYIRQKQEAEEEMIASLKQEGPGNETVYRDATGRRIDITSARAEARRKEREEAEERERMHRELQRGLVQKRNAAATQDPSDLKYTRTADDLDRNTELKSRVDQFHDPAASFLSKKKSSTQDSSSTSVTGRRLYQGHFAPNRFNIRPGHRWDGVDRSNGFEVLWFRKQNEAKEKKKLKYSMSYDM